MLIILFIQQWFQLRLLPFENLMKLKLVLMPLKTFEPTLMIAYGLW